MEKTYTKKLAECYVNNQDHKRFCMWPEGAGIRSQVDIEAWYSIPAASWSFRVSALQNEKVTVVYSPGVDGLNISQIKIMDPYLNKAGEVWDMAERIAQAIKKYWPSYNNDANCA